MRPPPHIDAVIGLVALLWAIQRGLWLSVGREPPLPNVDG